MAANRNKKDIKIRYKKDKWASQPDEHDLDSRYAICLATLIERGPDGREHDIEEIVVKGNCYQGAFSCGSEYRLFGKWIEKQPHGWSFEFESFVQDRPATRDAVVTYLRQCKGFGSVRAGLLFDKYGEGCIDILMSDPAKVSDEVRGLKLEDCEAAAELLRKSEHIRRSKLDLIGVIAGKGFPKRTVDSILKGYGAEAAEAVRRNPYLLMRYKGCGFLKTDKLYLDQGYDPTRLKRQALCAWHAVTQSGEGDTWVQKNKAITAIRQNVSGVDTNKIGRAILLAMKTDMLRYRVGEIGSQWIAEGKKAGQEEKVARLIIQAMLEAKEHPELVQWPDVDSLNVYPHQQQELGKSIGTQSFIVILAGSPGTGKTHSTAEVLKQIIATHGLDHVAACAPTGKAAVRMSEAFAKAQVPLQAVTTHSLLGVMSSDGGWTFEHNETNPLSAKFIVADEQSMKDIPLFGSLLAARGLGCHILLVGDTNQLSPVGHGAPLRDLIAAGVPTGTLTEIQRNSGRIVQSCAEIRDKHRFTPSPELDVEAGENLLIIETDEPEAQIETMEALIAKLKASEKYDPIWDVQILCAVNKKTSLLNRSALNKRVQGLLNPHGNSAPGNPFRVGDKVICLKNGSYESAVKTKVVRGRWERGFEDEPIYSIGDKYEDDPPIGYRKVWFERFVEDPNGPSTETETIGKQYVANGEQGEVLTVDTSRFVVRLANPDREVIVLRSSKNDDDDAGDSNDPSGEESTGTGCNWDLGYAISVHKSQGSEWPVVIVMLDDSGAAKQVCSRNWLYTAISRAKLFGLMIGKKSTALDMCRRDGLKRKTFLKELILEGMKEAGLEWPKPRGSESNNTTIEPQEGFEFTWTDEVISKILEGVV